MEPIACPECRALYQELQTASRQARLRRSWEPDASPRELAEWLAQIDEHECARLRLNSILWQVWRKVQEHRTLTGHRVSLPVSPAGGISHPN